MTERLDAARDRLHRLGVGMCAVLDPVDVGASYIAIGATLIGETHGRAAAADVLRDMADEYLADVEHIAH